MKMRFLIVALACIAMAAAAGAQSNIRMGPQGSSLPGLGGVPLTFDGPGYLEFSGAHSQLNGANPDWTDVGVRGAISGGKNTIDFEAGRQARYGESGWWYGAGLTRVLTDHWYASGFLGSSIGGLFLPRLRGDAFINRKFLPDKQLVLSFGSGFDKSKFVNKAFRNSIGGVYYFKFPVVLESGIVWTRSLPDGTLTHSQYVAVSQGRDKEHYITARAEIGREAYEILGHGATYFDFPIHNYSVNYKQWLGANFGVHFTFERDVNPFYHRNGGGVAFFIDF